MHRRCQFGHVAEHCAGLGAKAAVATAVHPHHNQLQEVLLEAVHLLHGEIRVGARARRNAAGEVVLLWLQLTEELSEWAVVSLSALPPAREPLLGKLVGNSSAALLLFAVADDTERGLRAAGVVFPSLCVGGQRAISLRAARRVATALPVRRADAALVVLELLVGGTAVLLPVLSDWAVVGVARAAGVRVVGVERVATRHAATADDVREVLDGLQKAGGRQDEDTEDGKCKDDKDVSKHHRCRVWFAVAVSLQCDTTRASQSCFY